MSDDVEHAPPKLAYAPADTKGWVVNPETKFTITNQEHEDERKARLDLQRENSRDARLRKQATYFVLLGMYVILFMGSLYVLATSKDEKMLTHAWTTVSALTTGIIGFVVGKAEKDEK